jgi:hypothetical protein
MKTRILVAAIALAGLAACSQEAPPAPSPGDGGAPAAAAASTPAPAPQAAPIGDATFSITPGSFRLCDAQNGAITATAKWDVAAKNVAEVSIYVTDAKGERKLWLNGGASGESTTGNWVFPDSKFDLVERASGKPLGELTVKATPCG